VLSFLAEYRTHPHADRANTRLLESYIRGQMRHEELTDWTVALISGPEGDSGRDPIDIGGALVRPILRNPKFAVDSAAAEGRYVIRRLLAPRDEGIDIDGANYQDALDETTLEWRSRPNEQRRGDTEPTTPSGPALRARRPATRGLLLLYPLSRIGDAGPLVEGEFPVIGFGISFPASRRAETVTYRVNNVFWQQEYGGEE
jgi:hypothetical protein